MKIEIEIEIEAERNKKEDEKKTDLIVLVLLYSVLFSSVDNVTYSGYYLLYTNRF